MLAAARCRRMPLRNRGPIVSFTFDDFPRSALEYGADILEEHGAHGTYYVAMSLLGSVNHLGPHFLLDDLGRLLERGHELGTHTLSHCSVRRKALAEFLADVDAGEEAVHASGFEPSGNFAYPYGDATLRCKGSVGTRMQSCRGTTGGINASPVDLNLLRANSLYGDESRADACLALIEENRRRSGWLIFYTHDVSAQPSRFGCTPELLRRAVGVAAESGARILSVEEVLREMHSPA
jgi:peptidoglycan/xylan/chitin deacetylase (PgdA/CDA1 family)